MLHSWLVHSSMNCTRSSTTELSDQLTLHSSEIGGKSLTLYTDYSVTTLIGGSVTNHAGRYPRRCTQECVPHEGLSNLSTSPAFAKHDRPRKRDGLFHLGFPVRKTPEARYV